MHRSPSKGFSLIEIMVVVAVIGIVMLLGIPTVRQARDRAVATATANDLRILAGAIEFYTGEAGEYPNTMSHSSMSPAIRSYLPASWQTGAYSWSFLNAGNIAAVVVYNLGFTPEQNVLLDRLIDDGNPASGQLRTTSDGTLVYFLSSP